MKWLQGSGGESQNLSFGWVTELHTEFGWKDENLHLSAIPRVSINRRKVGLASLTPEQCIYLDLPVVCITV